MGWGAPGRQILAWTSPQVFAFAMLLPMHCGLRKDAYVAAYLAGLILTLCASAACSDSTSPGPVGGAGGSAPVGGAGGEGAAGCVTETCNGFDDDCDGQVDEDCPCADSAEQECYAGNPITLGVGICRAGTQACDGGTWGTCTGSVRPAGETCNGFDDDCDGFVDDGCPCEAGTSQPCYSASPATAGVGLCREGTQSCSNGAWGPCVGEVVPTPEQCADGLDNDCDGREDEDCAPVIPARCNDQFADVPSSHPAYEAIHALYVHEVTDGCSSSPLLYCPDDDTLRHHFAFLLVKAMGESPSTAAMDAYFSDLTNSVTSPYVNRLYELGITNGCQVGLFCPDEPTTREQTAIFLIRALNESPSTAAPDAYFDDVAGTFGVDYINRLFELNVTTGCAVRLYCPAEPLLRAQAALFLARAFGYTLEICNP